MPERCGTAILFCSASTAATLGRNGRYSAGARTPRLWCRLSKVCTHPPGGALPPWGPVGSVVGVLARIFHTPSMCTAYPGYRKPRPDSSNGANRTGKLPEPVATDCQTRELRFSYWVHRGAAFFLARIGTPKRFISRPRTGQRSLRQTNRAVAGWPPRRAERGAMVKESVKHAG